MRPRFVLPLTALLILSACGGGGGGTATATPTPPMPTWQTPVDLVSFGYDQGTLLAGDGKGGVMAAWTHMGVDGGGTSYWELMAARLGADGTWEAPKSLEVVSGTNTLQAPVAALNDQGKGYVAWFSAIPRSTTTALRTVPVDLKATAPFGTRTAAQALDLRGLSDLHLAVGSDGSALAAWSYLRTNEFVTAYPTIQSSRFGAGIGWSLPAHHWLNPFSYQGLNGLPGDGRGAYFLGFTTGDDAWAENQVADFPLGLEASTFVTGWMPASQVTLPSNYQAAWALDGQGRVDAWMLYAIAGEGDPERQAWPRTRSAAGTWTVGDKVSLPLSTRSLAAFREASGTGWLAGLGSQGLWVAPLSGMTPGSPINLLPATTQTEVMVGTRDATGRPTLLWIQRGTGGTYEGIGCSRWDGVRWTVPLILPGTAGKVVVSLSAVAGPGGLAAGWVELGDRTYLLRTALWK